MEMFEGVTQALLPLVKNRNKALIQKLIAVVQTLDREKEDEDQSTGEQ
jgi:hypothetical protein